MDAHRLRRGPVSSGSDTDEEQQSSSAPTIPVAVPLTVGAVDDPAEVSAARMAETAIDRLRRTGPVPSVPAVASVQARMQSAFGRCFADVRVHDDASAAGLNRSLSARAFTSGRDVYFGAGEFRPEDPDGEQVLAHELAHVVQNDGEVHRWPGGKKKKKADGGDLGGADVDDAHDSGAITTTTTVLDPMQTPGNEGPSSTAATAFAVAIPLQAAYQNVSAGHIVRARNRRHDRHRLGRGPRRVQRKGERQVPDRRGPGGVDVEQRRVELGVQHGGVGHGVQCGRVG